MAATSSRGLVRMLVYGILTFVFYWGLVTYSEEISHLSLTTPDTCVVAQGPETGVYHKPEAEACQAKGGTMQDGNWMHVLAPIVIAFVISFSHGAFTGLFWEVVGLKAKK